MTPADNLGIIRAPPSTRKEVDLEESEFLLFYVSFLLICSFPT
jgi:hypothetical protein